MHLTDAAIDAMAEEVSGMSRAELHGEFDSLIRHTDEDALDSGELFRLGAVCIALVAD